MAAHGDDTLIIWLFIYCIQLPSCFDQSVNTSIFMQIDITFITNIIKGWNVCLPVQKKQLQYNCTTAGIKRLNEITSEDWLVLSDHGLKKSTLKPIWQFKDNILSAYLKHWERQLWMHFFVFSAYLNQLSVSKTRKAFKHNQDFFWVAACLVSWSC